MTRTHGRYSRPLVTLTGIIGLLSPMQLYGEEFIVKLKTLHAFQSLAYDQRLENGATIIDHHEPGQLLKIDIASDRKTSLEKKLINIIRMSSVEYIVPNVQLRSFGTPNDPQFSQQWALAKVNAVDAWSRSTGSKEVTVAVIDTGVDLEHEDLKSNIWTNADEIPGNNFDDDGNGYADDVNGWDFKQNDNDPQDVTSQQNPGHGTHCSGIIGAVGNNSTGIAGINHHVSIMPIRFLGEDGSGDLYAAAKAIDYATTNGAQIISASWGATVAEAGAAPIIEAIGRANEKGVLFIAAAANNGSNNDTKSVYPANANFPNMIAVAASDSNDAKPTWSNFGVSKVHISAPGHEILSTLPKDKYGKLSGTSMATPLVAGLVALALAVSDQKLDGPTMRAIIQASGTQVAIETACGCRIDAKAALAHIEDRVMTVVPNALTLAPQSTANFTAFNGEPPFKFTSANSAAGDIDATGKFTAKAVGDTKITVTDAKDKVASSLLIHVAEPTASGESCPLGDEALCAMLCAIEPTLPWCGKQFER